MTSAWISAVGLLDKWEPCYWLCQIFTWRCLCSAGNTEVPHHMAIIKPYCHARGINILNVCLKLSNKYGPLSKLTRILIETINIRKRVNVYLSPESCPYWRLPGLVDQRILWRIVFFIVFVRKGKCLVTWGWYLERCCVIVSDYQSYDLYIKNTDVYMIVISIRQLCQN